MIELVKDVLTQVSAAADAPSALEGVCAEIAKVGSGISVVKNSEVVAEGFRQEKFATAHNEIVEADLLRLHAFEAPSVADSHPGAEHLRTCIAAHTSYADHHQGIVEKIMQTDMEFGTR